MTPIRITLEPRPRPLPTDPPQTIPTRATPGAAGFDLTANQSEGIAAGFTKIIRTGLHVAIPHGHYADVRGRSSLAAKGIQVHLGLIDSDYRGEVGVIIHNASHVPFYVRVGDRIGQLVFPTIPDAQLVQVDRLDDTQRGNGGFGSTGVSA